MTGRTGTDSETVSIERRPEGVFELLGNDLGLRIVRVSGETPEPVPFAALQTRVDLRDSVQFNYHLGALRGSLVRRTDAGYEPTFAGRQVLGAIYAGTYTTDATTEPIPVEEECPPCGGTVHAAYVDETARIACTERTEYRNGFPVSAGEPRPVHP